MALAKTTLLRLTHRLATLRAESADELAEALMRVGVALGRGEQVAPVIARLRD